MPKLEEKTVRFKNAPSWKKEVFKTLGKFSFNRAKKFQILVSVSWS